MMLAMNTTLRSEFTAVGNILAPDMSSVLGDTRQAMKRMHVEVDSGAYSHLTTAGTTLIPALPHRVHGASSAPMGLSMERRAGAAGVTHPRFSR